MPKNSRSMSMPIGERVQAAARVQIDAFDHPSLGKDNERVRLVRGLWTDPAARRRGDARFLMCEICVEADNQGTVLVLEPKADENAPLDNAQLENFYRRFAFRVIQRAPVTLMARQPR